MAARLHSSAELLFTMGEIESRPKGQDKACVQGFSEQLWPMFQLPAVCGLLHWSIKLRVHGLCTGLKFVLLAPQDECKTTGFELPRPAESISESIIANSPQPGNLQKA